MRQRLRQETIDRIPSALPIEEPTPWSRTEFYWLYLCGLSCICFTAAFYGLHLSLLDTTEKWSDQSSNIRLFQDMEHLPIVEYRKALLSTALSFSWREYEETNAFMYHHETFNASLIYSPLQSTLFTSHVVFGMFPTNPHEFLRKNTISSPWSHDDMYIALSHMKPSIVLNCTFQDISHTWNVSGFLVAIPNDQYTSDIDHDMILHARTREQVHIWKWNLHSWGRSMDIHHTIIQEIIPTYRQFKSLEQKGPCYHIEER